MYEYGNRLNLHPEMMTEGIKYAGSKLKILPHIESIVKKLDVKSVLDGFSGSTRVSQMFAWNGYDVISNDISVWSEIFATAYLLHDRPMSYYKEMIRHLNAVPGRYGWFSEHYGGTPDSPGKKPFQLKNTMKLDAVRDEIDNMGLEGTDKAVALTSLILAMDAVDNTLGHYSAYLSGWSPRSYHDAVLEVPHLVSSGGRNMVFRKDIFDLLPEIKADLAYFDPPYGSNNDRMPSSRIRYNAYYHLWTSIILNDRPQIFGKAGRREDSRDWMNGSVFEDYKKDSDGRFIAMNAIERLVREAGTRYILLSYSSGGRVEKNALRDILLSEGRLIQCLEIDFRTNVMGQMRLTNEWANTEKRTCEYLFLLEK